MELLRGDKLVERRRHRPVGRVLERILERVLERILERNEHAGRVTQADVIDGGGHHRRRFECGAPGMGQPP
jgi:hypothetical protein